MIFSGVAHVLDNPIEPVNEASFFECLDTATERSQQLAQSMQDMTASLKKEDTETLANAASVASDAVCQLTESTAQVMGSVKSGQIILSFNLLLVARQYNPYIPLYLCFGIQYFLRILKSF